MTLRELNEKVQALEARIVALEAAAQAPAAATRTVTEKDQFGCRKNTDGFQINLVIAKMLETNQELDNKKIFQALGGIIPLSRVRQQVPYLRGKGLLP